jgi:transposase
MMDRKELEETNTQLMQINDALRADYEAMRMINEAILNDVAKLKTDYATLVDATRVLAADRDALKQKNIELETINKRLTDMLWGRRSERRTSFTGQTPLDFGDDVEAQPEVIEAQASPEVITAQQSLQEALDKRKLEELEERRKNRRERKNRNEAFPESIERRVRVLDLPEDQKAGLKYLGTKITERLRFEKPNIYVEQIQRLEYVKADAPELGVQSVPPPPSIIEGCKYDFSIIAAVAAMKVGFHMPTYRQETFFGQSGWNPSRSTLNDLMNYAVDCIDPLFEQMWSCVNQQPIILGDATTLTVLLRDEVSADDQQTLDTRKKNRDKALQARLKALRSENTSASKNQAAKQPGSATSYAWLYTGLDDPERSSNTSLEHPPPTNLPPDFSEPRWQSAPYNIFYWSLTQQHSVIDQHLEKFQGTFVGDAIGGNARLGARSGGRIAHQSCNAHARREFVKAESNDPLLASQMVSFYRQLYAVEYRAAELTPDERLALRQREAVPIWQRMQAWLERDDVKRLLPKSGIGQAASYLRNQWSSLQLYLRDGRLPIDNNQSENTIRPLTIGRKNWLFLGSAIAAPGRMKLFSIVSSAQRHCLSVQDYLEDILLRLSQAAQHDPKQLEVGSTLLQSLLPDRWGVLHPQHVLRSRQLERHLTAENKQYYRLQAGLTGSHPYAQTPSLSNVEPES